MESNNYFKSLSYFSDAEFHKKLGINNWSKRALSYNELQSLNRLVYDDQGIFIVDRLAILFWSHFEHPFFISSYKFQDKDFPKRFNITDKFTLVKLRREEITYLDSYSVELNDQVVGVLSCKHNLKRDQAKFKLNKDYLYQNSIGRIISDLMFITSTLEFSYQNVAEYELAYDSTTDYHSRIMDIYLNSTECNAHNHRVYNWKPKYRLKGSKRRVIDTVDPINKSKGTYTEGSKNSCTQLKIYDKTYELKCNPNRLISEIYEKHFGANTEVYRVEMSANSSCFHDTGIFYNVDIIELLHGSNFQDFYIRMLGDKLVYRSIDPIGYDENNNEKYEVIKIIEFNSHFTKQKKLKVVSSNQYKTHSRNVNDFKFVLNKYLDGVFDFKSLLNYVENKRKNGKVSRDELASGLEVCMKNYENPVSDHKRRVIKELQTLLNQDANSLRWMYFKLKRFSLKDYLF